MKRKQLLSAVLVLALSACMLLSGCASSSKLVAKIGNEKVTLNQLQSMYDNYSAYAVYYGYTLDSEENIAAFREDLLSTLLSSAMLVYQAKKAGLSLTDEEIEQAKQTAQESFDSTYESFRSSAEQAGASDVSAYATQLLTNALAQNGMTLSGMKKDLLESAKDDLLASKMRDQIRAEVSYTADELAAKYEETLKTQKESFDADTTAYFTAAASSEPVVYIPEGLFRVRHILVADETTAKEVLDKLNNGEEFEKLLTQYNTDPGMGYEQYASGYLVGTGANFVESFLNAALALEKEGDVSEITESTNGFHIIKRMKNEPAGATAYADIQETFDAYWQNQLASEHYTEVMDAWLADTSLVTRYEENISVVGAA